MVEGTRLLRWSGASNGIGSHRIALEMARVSQIAEPALPFRFARLRHSSGSFWDDRGDPSWAPMCRARGCVLAEGG